MADFDAEDWNQAVEDVRGDENHQRIDEAPTINQRLGRFTVVCLILNRTIGKVHFTILRHFRSYTDAFNL
jgi:hypothetical protein